MSVVSLPEIKVHLNLPSTTDVDDPELQRVTDAAEALIANLIGPLAPTTVTTRVHGGPGPLELPVRPVISLTSVTPGYGAALDVSTLDVDPTTGIVAFSGYASSYLPYFPNAYYTVVYQAGFSTLPDDLRLAVKELTRHLWESQRGPVTRPGLPPDQTTPNYLIPYRVQELLAPYMSVTFA